MGHVLASGVGSVWSAVDMFGAIPCRNVVTIVSDVGSVISEVEWTEVFRATDGCGVVFLCYSAIGH